MKKIHDEILNILYRKCILLVGTAVISSFMTSCFTGIEGTKKVEMGREERKQSAPTPEETFLMLSLPSLNQWQKGKEFMVTDDRLSYILEIEGRQPGECSTIAGKILKFSGISGRSRPDGSKETVIHFDSEGCRISYNTGKNYPDAEKSLTSKNLPMLIDLDIVAEADSMLSGKRLYTRSSLWYDGDSTKVEGRKFVEVSVTGVTPGITEFPLRIHFKDSSGREAFMFMNSGNGGYDSRSFANLFTLSDIRNRYPKITDAFWELITRSKVAPGMTKEECKLALGNPIDVVAGHSYSQTLDLWQYPNGTVLRFADGILISTGH